MEPIVDSEKNDIGAAACLAILSAIDDITFPSDFVVLGGCDILGNLYLGHKQIDTVLLNLPQDVKHIFGPLDTTKRIYRRHSNMSVNILETPNVRTTYQIAKSWSVGGIDG